MVRISLPAALVAASLFAAPAWADSQGARPDGAKSDAATVARQVSVRPIAALTTTAAGQPIVLPQKDAQVLVSTYEIAPGAVLPVHKHPYPRYAFVQAGTLRVTNADTGKVDDYKPGDFIAEMVEHWHSGTATGTEPVKLLVIDIVEKGKANTVLRGAH